MTQNPLDSNFEETALEGLRAIYKQMALQNQLLERIASATERTADSISQMAQSSKTEAPNLTAPLESFSSFDWTAIGATVERSDRDGAAIVSWRGLQFVRRSPSNKFGEAIWFSRCVGKDDAGENKYERLITFRPLAKVEVEPVPAKVARIYGNSSKDF